MSGGYERQARGDRGAYERYLRGMDASMRQKVALTAAHFLGAGVVADMGMGSGAGSRALAALYPGLDVVGVDVNPAMVGIAREQHRAPNLAFMCGDIAAHCFRPESLDGIFDSSVLHHVTTFSGYDHQAAAHCLEVQVAELKPGGVLVIRDFVAPEPGEVLLELPETDGDAGDDPRACSTAALFRRFAREFRRLHASPGFAYRETECPRAGWTRFEVGHRMAVEFVLRKDYRQDWAAEVLEEYTYFTQREFEAVCARLGLRLLASTPLWNPWIVRHRYRHRFEIRGLDGAALEPPPTNILVAAEKVPPGAGVTFTEEATTAPSFLRLDHYRDRRTGALRDLVRRPHPTIDVLPWFTREDDVYVLARRSYPRPILCAEPRGTTAVDASRAPGYVTEPLNVLLEDQPLGRTVETALDRLAGIPAAAIHGMGPGIHYYPSPGGIEEEVRSVLVEIEPVFVERRIENLSGFTTSGVVRALEARQLLRAAQVGALPDARLEINVYALLRRLGVTRGPWIGEAPEIPSNDAGPEASLDAPRTRRVFEPAGSGESAGFLDLHAATFAERDASGSVVARRVLEWVVPRTLSTNTVTVAPLRRHDDRVLVGIDDDDLPAAQAFGGCSDILVAPAWRLPKTVCGRSQLRAWVRERLAREYGLETGEIWELGGRYHPSAGLTPEVVHPLAVEARGERPAPRRLTWVALPELVRDLARLRDGHLLVLALRAAHALSRADAAHGG